MTLGSYSGKAGSQVGGRMGSEVCQEPSNNRNLQQEDKQSGIYMPISCDNNIIIPTQHQPVLNDEQRVKYRKMNNPRMR